jgi:hypothetical protein
MKLENDRMIAAAKLDKESRLSRETLENDRQLVQVEHQQAIEQAAIESALSAPEPGI